MTIDSNNPPAQNPVVARCLQAFQAAYDAAKKQGKDDSGCTRAGCEAYRNLMPPLDSSENIRDFVACVTRGMLLDSYFLHDSRDLLYAAQVAVSALRAQPKEKKSPGRPKGSKSRIEDAEAA